MLIVLSEIMTTTVCLSHMQALGHYTLSFKSSFSFLRSSTCAVSWIFSPSNRSTDDCSSVQTDCKKTMLKNEPKSSLFLFLDRFMGMHIFDCFQGLCYLEISLPLIWFWLMRSRSSLLSSSGIVSELGSASGSRFRMEMFSGISGIRGSIAWLCLFNVLKSLFTCGFKGLKNWERVAWWYQPQYHLPLYLLIQYKQYTISFLKVNRVWHHWPGP